MKLGIARILACAAGAVLLAAAPSPASGFDASQRGQIIEGIKKAMGHYIDPKVTAAVDAQLDSDRAKLVAIVDPREFAKAVTGDLRAAGHDKHLYLAYSDQLPPPGGHANESQAEIAHDTDSTRLHNAGVRGAYWLPGNIGFINLRGFPGMYGEATRHPIDAAMAVVANTDALIIDLRNNGGGDPDTLDYWMGYFFAKPTELTQIHWVTPTAHIDRQYSASSVAGPRYTKPVYVLTSAHTYSCAEQFAYDMQSLHRATLVGETTGGAANPGDFTRLNDHFAVFVPTGRAYNPYTRTNWEGVGVKPEVPTTADGALLRAYTLGLQTANDSFDELVVDRAAILKDPAQVLSNYLK